MNKTKLISEQFIKDFSPLMNNVENQFIGIHILEAQNIELRFVIGDDLYNEMVDEYTEYAENGFININTYVSVKNQTLRDDYIKWILLYYTLYHSIYDLSDKLTNKGILQQHSNNSTNVYSPENRRKDYKNIAETYVSRMLDYLNNNLDIYPLYQSYIQNDCTINNRFDSGWYLGSNLKN